MQEYYLVSILFVSCITGQTYQDYRKLYENLFNESRYDTEIRPMFDQSKHIHVNITMGIYTLDSFDLSTGEIICLLYFVIAWKDELVRWNPNDYGNISGFTVPKGRIWRPNLVFNNQNSNKEASLMESDFSVSYAWYTGDVLAVPTGKYRSLCQLNTKYYPFDKHMCIFEIFVENHVSTEIMLHIPLNTVILEHYKSHSEWEVIPAGSKINYNSIEALPFAGVSLENTFYIKRKPLFEILATIMPIWLLSFLSLATPYVRPTSGERLTFAITVYLAFVFATTAFNETVPRSADDLTMATIFTFILSLFNTINVLWSMFIVWLVGVRNETIQRFPKCMATLVKSKRTRIKHKAPGCGQNSVHHFDDGQSDTNEGQSNLEVGDMLDGNISLELRQNYLQNRISKGSDVPEREIDTTNIEEIANTLDRYFFYVSLFSNGVFFTVLTVLCFANGAL